MDYSVRWPNWRTYWLIDKNPPKTRRVLFFLIETMSRIFLLGAFALIPLSIGTQAQAQTNTTLPKIQGAAAASPLVDQNVIVAGTVTAMFPQLRGFYIQDPKGDGDDKTSDGAFVYLANKGFEGWPTFKVGDAVTVTGRVQEFHDQTQISNLTALTVQGQGGAVTPVEITFPLPIAEREKYEGMLVKVTTQLSVTDNYPLRRYGSLSLSSGGRIFVPSNQPTPDADSDARKLVLDDASNKQNPQPIPYLDNTGTRRAGSTVTNLTGILAFDFDEYRLFPTGPIEFEDANPRPATAPTVGGNVKIASANLHNYWTTFKSDANPDARGASTPAEFESQSAKIVTELKGLDADAVALMELENNGDGAIDDLVTRLNKAYGAAEYAKAPAPANGFGTDKIRVGFIYKPARVKLVGASQSAADTIFERLPVAQTFAFGKTNFTLVANHWKSKGSAPETGDVDMGQGAWNKKRVQQAQATLKFVQTLNQPNVMLVGDFNAYSEEDPLKALRAAGMKQLNLRLKPEERYSFGFGGKFGSLDHAFASDAMDKLVSGFAEWHINSDEPEFELEQSKGTPFRASDHDPFLVGLNLPAN
ncbi:ExeM/NucH family extracellular endonuclease [bacterium]|nr:MAG: ExeM/NucH family extracellular endonuclease [bacterium]